MTRKSTKDPEETTGSHDHDGGAEQAARELQQMLKDDPLIAFRGVLTENKTLRELASSNNQKFLITLIFLALAVGAAYAGWARSVEYRYFYINEEGHVYETQGLRYPVATHARVNNFARDIAVQMHTWTYRNYLDVFTDLQDVCTPSVITQYYNALGENGVFTTAAQYSQRYEGALIHSRVESEQVIDSDGRKSWRVNLTVSEEIIGTSRPISREYDMMIDVTQVPLSVSPRGLMCTRIDENYRERS